MSLNEDNIYEMLNCGTKMASISLGLKGADIPKEKLSDFQ